LSTVRIVVPSGLKAAWSNRPRFEERLLELAGVCPEVGDAAVVDGEQEVSV
jgi:hypothetical protein